MEVPRRLAEALEERSKGIDWTGIRAFEITFEDGEEITVLCRNPPSIEKKLGYSEETGETFPSWWASQSPIYQKLRADKVICVKEMLFEPETVEPEPKE